MSPEYTALIVSLPRLEKLVAQVAVREVLTITLEHPEIVVPFALKATVPVGVGGPAGVIVAVNVTDSLGVDGFALDARVVVEAALFTVCDNVGLALD